MRTVKTWKVAGVNDITVEMLKYGLGLIMKSASLVIVWKNAVIFSPCKTECKKICVVNLLPCRKGVWDNSDWNNINSDDK